MGGEFIPAVSPVNIIKNCRNSTMEMRSRRKKSFMLFPLPGVGATGNTQFVRLYLGDAAAARSKTWCPILCKPQQTGMPARCQGCSFCWGEIQDYLQSRRKQSIQVKQAGVLSHELPRKHHTEELAPSDKERRN